MAGKLFNVFYGTRAEEIARWCLVTLNTAYQFKRGDRKPGPQSLRLFLLHRQGRVLGDEWEGWSVRDGVLYDPEGNGTTQGQLRAYYYVYQLARELSRDHQDARERLEQIMERIGG